MSSTFDRFGRRFAAALIVAACAGAPGLLAAQSDPPPAAPDPARDASARAMFEEGVRFVEAGDFVQAEDRFRRALALRDSPVIAYNLASTLVERSALVEASELLRKLVRDPSVAPELRQSATDLQAQIAPRIGRLRVTVEGGAVDDRVSLDGQPLLAAQLGVDIPIDPGHHELQLHRGSNLLDTQPAQIASGAALEVTLRAGPAPLSPGAVASASVAPDRAAPPPSTASDGAPITRKWWFWTGAAVLAGAAIATAVILASDSDPGTREPFRGDFDPPSFALEVSQ